MDDPATPTDPVAVYAAALFRQVLRRLARRTDLSVLDRDDIAQDTVEQFLADPAGVMARYPQPHIYAAACAGSRAEDWRRRERAQRSEGARLVLDQGGRPAVARPVDTLSNVLPINGPKVSGGFELVDLLADFADDVGLFAVGRARAALEGLLGAEVDLVPERALKDDVRETITPELIAL